MKLTLAHDDLAAIAMLAHDAMSAGAQANEARAVGAHAKADALEAGRHVAIVQIYKLLGVDRS
jgi:hypothetical protein